MSRWGDPGRAAAVDDTAATVGVVALLAAVAACLLVSVAGALAGHLDPSLVRPEPCVQS